MPKPPHASRARPPCLQIRLETLLRLQAIKWLCFLFLEADYFMRAPGHGCGLAWGCQT